MLTEFILTISASHVIGRYGNKSVDDKDKPEISTFGIKSKFKGQKEYRDHLGEANLTERGCELSRRCTYKVVEDTDPQL